jgi:preprotein translocase subunit SecD
VVALFLLTFYRVLGVIAVTALGVYALYFYALIKLIPITLTLPGIAGLIVAVGITADSFIVYFERIRDEMRSGKSMRVAVETGWVRARATCLAADTVSLLAAVVLYIFSIGVVKGFAFALGISTVIDLVVFFLFTKPMVSWLATFPFFFNGHKLSGLSPDQVGAPRTSATMRPTTPTTVGGNA